MENVKIEMSEIGGSGEVKGCLGKEEMKVHYNVSRKRTKTMAYFSIVVSSMFFGFVFFPIVSPILFTSTTVLMWDGGPMKEEKLESLSRDVNNDGLSWTPIGIGLGLEILTQLVISFSLLKSTKTNGDPNVGLPRIRFWLRTNAFLTLLDFYSFFFQLYWLIFGVIIILSRFIMSAVVERYLEMSLQMEAAAKATDAKTESPEQ